MIFIFVIFLLIIISYSNMTDKYKHYLLLFIIVHSSIIILLTSFSFIFDPMNEGFFLSKNDQYKYMKDFYEILNNDYPFFNHEFISNISKTSNYYTDFLVHSTLIPLPSFESAVILGRAMLFCVYFFIFFYSYKISKFLPKENQKLFMIIIILSPTFIGRYLIITRDLHVLAITIAFYYYFISGSRWKIFIPIYLAYLFRNHYGFVLLVSYGYYLIYSKFISKRYFLFIVANLLFVAIIVPLIASIVPGKGARILTVVFVDNIGSVFYNYFLSLISLTFLGLSEKFYSFGLASIIAMRLITFDMLLVHFIFTYSLLKKEFYDMNVVFLLITLFLFVTVYTFAILISPEGMFSINFRSLLPFSYFMLFILLSKYKINIPTIKFGKKVIYRSYVEKG